MHTKEIPLSINNTGNFYSDFLTRLGAGLLDGLIMSPVWIAVLILNSQSLGLQYFLHALNLLFGAFYMIYLPKRYGGTPGKLISGLKIVKMDGSDLDWLAAFNRYSVSLALAFFTTGGTIYALTQADPETFDSLSWIEKTEYLQSFNPVYQMMLVWITGAWTLADIVVFFTNDRRRALHDMVGGTVVIKKIYHDKIKQYMAGELPPDQRAAYAE